LPPANAWLLNGNFRDLLNLRAASLLQPHITHCSGITKKAIATLAEAYYAESFRMQKSILLGDIASMHVMATVPNFVAHQIPNLQAAPTDKVQRSYLGKSYMKKPLVMTEGSIIIKKILMVPVWY
jgi:galactonate dehydratase